MYVCIYIYSCSIYNTYIHTYMYMYKQTHSHSLNHSVSLSPASAGLKTSPRRCIKMFMHAIDMLR